MMHVDGRIHPSDVSERVIATGGLDTQEEWFASLVVRDVSRGTATEHQDASRDPDERGTVVAEERSEVPAGHPKNRYRTTLLVPPSENLNLDRSGSTRTRINTVQREALPEQKHVVHQLRRNLPFDHEYLLPQAAGPFHILNEMSTVSVGFLS
ncbi:hypothetical protein EPO33_02520 [Patescibacteria group bacterium]|nr:MAG: hypothetical protein EPO33_02520 [Patescibacteria group bacterium]